MSGNRQIYPKKQKVYLTITKGNNEYLLETFIIEKDGSFYTVSAKNENERSAPILTGKFGIDTAIISTGEVKHTRHPDGRSHFQQKSSGCFKTLQESIVSTPPYFVAANFRLLSMSLSGPLNIKHNPLFKKQTPNKISFEYDQIQENKTDDIVIHVASVKEGKLYRDLSSAIEYLCSKDNLNLIPRQWAFHEFDYGLPTLFILISSKSPCLDDS